MSMIIGLVALATVALVSLTWWAASRAVAKGQIDSARDLWSSAGSALLIVPSLVEEHLERGSAWALGVCRRLVGTSTHSLLRTVLAATVGIVVWLVLFGTIRSMDVK